MRNPQRVCSFISRVTGNVFVLSRHLIFTKWSSPFMAMTPNISEREASSRLQQETIKLLGLISSSSGTRDLLSQLNSYLKDFLGCDAVGIRLRSGKDFPYFETFGLSSEFIEAENRLCAMGPHGEVLLNEQGHPVLECMCGVVLSNRCDPSKHFFTSRGSFWTGNTAGFLTETSEADRQTKTRNRCYQEGFQSLALILLRVGDEILGLVHIGDRRQGMFSGKMLHFIEELVGYAAVGLSRCLAQEALHRSEERYALAVQAGQTGVWDYRIAIGKLYADRNLSRLFGFEKGELTDDIEDWIELLYPEDIPKVRSAINEHIEGRTSHYEEEYRVVVRDGSVRWMRASGSVIRDEQGHPVRMVGTTTDITRRKLAEQELERYRAHLEELVDDATRRLEESQEKLQHSERLISLGTFAAGIAHEINNPVGAILLAAENALDELNESGGIEQVQDALRRIIRNARLCGQVVRNVLQFARREQSEKWSCDLHQVIEFALERVGMRAELRQARIECKFAPEPLLAVVSPVQLEQVMVNLLNNAIESRAAGAHIQVSTQQGENSVKIVVQDDGRGITEKQHRHIFDPFYTSRRNEGGTGLGLSIAHGIVAEHGGSIDVESQPDKGMKVIVELSREGSGAKVEDPDGENPGRG